MKLIKNNELLETIKDILIFENIEVFGYAELNNDSLPIDFKHYKAFVKVKEEKYFYITETTFFKTDSNFFGYKLKPIDIDEMSIKLQRSFNIFIKNLDFIDDKIQLIKGHNE